MRKIIGIIFTSLLLTSCSDVFDFNDEVDKRTTVVTNSKIIYPDLPNIDKPLPPLLKTVNFDYPRDLSKPKELKATPECLQEPKIANYNVVCFEYPLVKNSNIFIGMDKQSFQNYISNQELINGYSRTLGVRIEEINAERARWREINQQKEK